MNAQSTPFAYDDFEQYLLEAAKMDQAPPDLPARLGVALRLGIPILVAAEIGSVIPTTTSLASGAGVAEIGAVSAPQGLLAAIKASLGVGSSTLWSTAAKGIAVGVLSGAALVGTVRAVVKVSERSSEAPNATMAASHGSNRAGRVHPAAPNQPATLAQPTDEAAADATEADSGLKPQSDDASLDALLEARQLTRGDGLEHLTTSDPTPEKSVMRRLPHPIIPEKTNAIARYPLVYDDVSALYDEPKKVAAALPVAAKAVDNTPPIAPAELQAMRTKTLAQSRTLLGQSRASQALVELNNFRKRVGDRNFGVDELLLHIEALAMLGRAKEAQADVAKVERLAPNSGALRQAQLLARSRFVR